jgi:DNA-binding IclR family transcriptional regulator
MAATDPDARGPDRRETSQTLDRGLSLLQILASTGGGSVEGLTITELAAALQVSRPVVYRLVTTLEDHGYVRRSADGRARLGFGVLHLASQVQPLLRAAATPVLRRLAEDAGCTAHLTIAEGTEALAIAVVEPTWTDFHVAYRVGSRHPLSRGAAGRAILAARGESSAATSRPGYVVSAGELQPGAHGVAAPVLGVSSVEASVGVVALADLDVKLVGPKVVAAAAEVARALQ